MTPTTTRIFIKLKSANIITMSPAALKKIPALGLFWMENELKLMSERTGKVPKANASIVSPPMKKLPVESV